jgi:hypothetical protein
MRRTVGLWLLGAGFFGASLAAQAPSPTPPPVTAIRAARMFDGKSDVTIVNVVHGGFIGLFPPHRLP